ncbi:MAG: aminotransferase DegT [Thermoprotei archaeon]|nr:MAG: aminotransferase DegT [Thermoprotei archaeon]
MKYKIPIAEPEIGEEELKNVMEAVKSGWVSSKGPFIEEFEKSFSNYIGVKYGIATSNGTAALHLALVALGIGRGDKVLVPSLTFIATANAVTYTGAEPVFVDSHPEYWCIDPFKIEEKIDDKTKAIIVVHLYGHPCDMDEIMRIAEDHNLHVIEDCAEAHGAEYKGRKVGSFGIISCFSFYGNKIITTGEGGMCLTNNEELAGKMRVLRDHGMNPNKKYWHDVIGFNYRMTNLQAALGIAQLKKIDLLVAKKRQIASLYKKLLQDLPFITIAPEMPWAKNVYWLYSVLVKKEIKDKIMASLEEKGIETRPFFHPIHMLPPYKSSLTLPVAEELSAKGLNLPSGFRLSENQIKEIVEVLREV